MPQFTSSTTTNYAGNSYNSFNFTVQVVRRPPDDGLARCYAVLGVPPGAPPDVIRKGYRKSLMQAHPDHGGSSDAVMKVMAAYERLK